MLINNIWERSPNKISIKERKVNKDRTISLQPKFTSNSFKRNSVYNYFMKVINISLIMNEEK